MVVERPSENWQGDPLELIRSFPFTRFFNHGERDATPIEFSSAEMLEKLDGTMIGVFFPTGQTDDPHWHTRRVVTWRTSDNRPDRILKAAGEYLQHLSFDTTHLPYTFVFEFVHRTSFVRTRYRPEDFGLYLIGARNVRTHQEPHEDQLDEMAQQIGARRPRRWRAVTSQDEIQRIMRDMVRETPDFEGFVFRDQTSGARIKMKDPDYVRALHLAGQIS